MRPGRPRATPAALFLAGGLLGSCAGPGTAPAPGENPLAPSEANLAAGRRLYERDARPAACVACHGPEGRAPGAIGRFLTPAPPHLRQWGQSAPRRTHAELFMAIRDGGGWARREGDPAFETLRRPGRRDRRTPMPAHDATLSDRQIWQLVLYLRTLDGAGSEPASRAGAGEDDVPRRPGPPRPAVDRCASSQSPRAPSRRPRE